MHAIVLQVCGVSAILTDPGPVCEGDTVVLNCTIPAGVLLRWNYNDERIGGGIYAPSINEVPPTNPDTVGNVVFTHSLLDSSPDIVSQLSFTASADVNCGIILCAGRDAASAEDDYDNILDDITVQVEQTCESQLAIIFANFLIMHESSDPAPAEVRVVDIVNGSDSSTVTIEWTPPADLVQYTTTTTPVPISPTMSVTTTPPTTDPIQMDIILEYNRDYTITVSIETCAGPRQTTTTVSILRGLINTQCHI